MKKVLLVLGLMIGMWGRGQITYHKYLDCSSEWRYYTNKSWDWDTYETYFFDGDTLINNLGYYKLKCSWKKISNPPSATTFINSCGYFREDSNLNFIRGTYNNGSLVLDTIYKFNSIINLVIGSTIPKQLSNIPNLFSSFFTYYPGCTVLSNDTFTLGTKQLKAVSTDPFSTSSSTFYSGIVEGIGATYPPFCSTITDFNYPYLVYYSKDGNQITFQNQPYNAYNYDSFPIPIRVNTCSLLPIKILSFTVQKENNNVLLNWQTANEVNVSHINIQRSTNGSEFVTIGNVNASCCTYSFVDNKLPITNDKLTLNYRLETVDKDGSKTYSEVKNIEYRTRNNELRIYPNPAKDVVTIEYKNAKEVMIVDYLGRVVYEEILRQAQNDATIINIKSFNKGLYVVKAIMKNGEIKTEKLLVE